MCRPVIVNYVLASRVALSLRFEELCTSSCIPLSDAPAIAADLHRVGEVC